jgi:hypothetical protein
VTDAAPLATFGTAVELAAAGAPPTATAGSYLYVDLLWQGLPSLAALPADLSLSLRLYAANGQAVAQADAPLHDLPTRTWDATLLYPQVAALPVPADTAPGPYTLSLVVYRQDNAEALPVAGEGSNGEDVGIWALGTVDIAPKFTAAAGSHPP